jgi:uncharacterized protein
MNYVGLVGRKDEYQILEKSYKSSLSQLIIIYGRRRVGKTFLVNQSFENKFAFKITGVYKQNKNTQLANFSIELSRADNKEHDVFKNWSSAFSALKKYLDSLDEKEKQVVFFDEMPWLDNKKSDFFSAFEFFWNNYGCAKNNLLFIVAGSSSSWITNKLINNKGGFFNRHSARLYLEPFSLKETKEYLVKQNIHWSNYDIAQCYMVMGGIPFYLSQIDSSKTLSDNIDYMFFKKHGLLWDEFSRLYGTLFNNDLKYINIVEVLSKNRYGLSKSEIASKCKLSSNGDLTHLLQNLIDSGFIIKNTSYSERKGEIYQLSDFYTLFYFEFIKDNYGKNENFWNNSFDLPKRRTWLGFSFELLCKMHLKEIRDALSIGGINSTYYSYNKKGNDENKGCQIDLVIDRRDNVASIIEIKYSINEFEITKDYQEDLRNKIAVFEGNNPRKSIQMVLITTYGLKMNMYSNIINKVLTINDLL